MDVQDPAVTVLFELKDEDAYVAAWTTTPWTLPSNTALCVGPKIEYVLVKTFNQYTFEPINVILAKNLVAYQFNKNYFDQLLIEVNKSFKKNILLPAPENIFDRALGSFLRNSLKMGSLQSFSAAGPPTPPGNNAPLLLKENGTYSRLKLFESCLLQSRSGLFGQCHAS